MAEEYLRKSKYNEAFCKAIEEKFPGSFYDYRVVSLFYCAIHLLKYYCLQEFGVYVGDTHYDIKNNTYHKSSIKTVTLPTGMWDEYHALYLASKTARYEGIKDLTTFEIAMKADYAKVVRHLTRFKLYAKSGKSL